MQICQPHWNAIRDALKKRGIDHLGAKNSEEAIAAIVTDLEGRGAENEFDPLMGCNNMIFAEGLKRCGLRLMQSKEDGTQYCPICESMKEYELWWIEGPAEAMLTEAKEKGLV